MSQGPPITFLLLIVLLGAGLLFSGSAAFAQTAGAQPSLQGDSRSQLIAAMDSASEAHAADSTVAGVSVAVAQEGEMLLHEGYGKANIELGVPTPKDGVYEVGSITKQFTAAAVLQLAAKDSLDLDADITEYLSEFNARGRSVTVRQLLYHTSGLPDYLRMRSFEMIVDQEVPSDTLLSLVEAEPFRFAPGSAMSYSNSGYFLLGLLIEEASGLSYEDYLEERLLGPAGMEASHYCDEHAVVEQATQGYAFRPGEGLQRRPVPDHKWPYSAGSLCSTARDLVRWTEALHGGEVLSDSMYKEMIRPGRLSDGTELRYAMGLAVAEVGGRPTIAHRGGINGFISLLRYYPEEHLTVAVLQNTYGPRTPTPLADTLGRLALGPVEEPAPSTSEGEIYEGDLSKLTGRYSGPARGELLTLVVEEKEGSLVARKVGSGEERHLKHLSGLTFLRDTEDMIEHYTFVRKEEETIELRLDQLIGHHRLQRVGEL